MTSMAMAHPEPLLLLLLLLQIQPVVVVSLLPSAGTYTNHTAVPSVVPCLSDQASALLRLKRSFTATNHTVCDFRSWRVGTDCCRWEGVRCGDANGRVTSLDLGDCGLESGRLDPTLFKLTSLRYLNLGGNDFNMSEIPSTGFERLTKLTHLNLSGSNFAGQVPHTIGRLTNLISLDLSFRYEIEELFDSGYSYYWGRGLPQPGQLELPNFTALVANLSSLRELRLGFVDLSKAAEWCNALAKYTPNLCVLSLPFCRLSTPICGSLSALHTLSVINLQYNNLFGPIPEFFANFSFLRVVQLSFNKLEGWVPPIIFEHKKLVTIDLHRNPDISGTLPNFSADSCLENLLLGRTNFSGIIPSSIGNLKYLKKLGLDTSGFAGELPSSMRKLRSLNSLHVSGLEVVGSIPSWITNLTSLEVLEFSNCGLHGPIPSFIGDLMKLRKLALYNCNFSGEIPSYISNLTQLDTLLLHSNGFIGTIELASFWRLPNLFELNLSNNKLVLVDEEDNSSLVSFPDLTYLSLASCSLTKFPNILRHLNGINGLDLSNNQINGAIPQWAWEKWTGLGLFFMNLSHNKFTSVGYNTFLPFSVQVLDLSFNMFEGLIPIPQSGDVLDYSSNSFSSMPFNISTQLGETTFFMASRNNLSGKISPSFCGTSLEFLDLSHNNLRGSIPSCLMEDANVLQVLSLKANKLAGELPHNVNESCTFQALDFSDNWIGGQLPRSLASCKNLEVLDVGNNQIRDSFPCWMSALPKLQFLVLKSNEFFGQVAQSLANEKDTCEFPSIRIVDLSSNNFSGPLPQDPWFKKLKSMMVRDSNTTLVMDLEVPQEAGNLYKFTAAVTLTYKGQAITCSKILTSLVFIDVSNNGFHGSVPEAIGELALLHTLNMSHNSLTGPIPSQLGQLNHLEALDLSSNEFSGMIPQGIASLDSLSMLNLSYNNLEGKIPESPHFMTFSNSSFLGNDGLCGFPLSKGCSNITTLKVVPHPSKNSADIILFLLVGLGFGVGFAVVIAVTWGIRIRK